ncbi:hypothetical protein ACFVZ4_30155 [Streptomyces goshikiensis]|uniref:hypothetical protein n=1 Tax=Streptomyces goshikiensis TaxID=1942 RepID=UPI0036AA32AE
MIETLLDPETLTVARTTRNRAHDEGRCAQLLAAQNRRRAHRARLDAQADPTPEGVPA